jgi:hypothetical protein
MEKESHIRKTATLRWSSQGESGVKDCKRAGNSRGIELLGSILFSVSTKMLEKFEERFL